MNMKKYARYIDMKEGFNKKNSYNFDIGNERTIHISSDFDGGNIVLFKQINDLSYNLHAVNDGQGTSKKTWFHFKVRGSRGLKIKLQIQNIAILDALLQQRIPYKVMFAEMPQMLWAQHPQSFITYRDQTILIIQHSFKSAQDVFFCLTVPFSYEANQLYIEDLMKKVPASIHLSNEVIAQTQQQKAVHLLTLTDIGNANNLSDHPAILITARVHPGETSSTFCMQGMLQFLLCQSSLQAYLLRKLFVVYVVPILNPDGVYQGNYRMDNNGINLNRTYSQPKQGTAVHSIIQLVAKIHYLEFYFDLHSHSCMKEAFIYGNAFDDIVAQTYSELFCSIVEKNSNGFKYSLCNFDQKHMKFKDKGETMSKQGCGRVVISKLANVTRSYTIQTSIFPLLLPKTLDPVPNKQFAIIIDDVCYKLCQKQSSKQNPLIMECKNLGSSIMVSVLDMIRKNPYSRMDDCKLEEMAKEVALKLLQGKERFKLMDIRAHSKAKFINRCIKQLYDDKIENNWVAVDARLKSIKWTDTFKNFKLVVEEKSFLKKKQLCKKKEEIQKPVRSISSKGNYPLPQIKYSLEVKEGNKPQITQLILQKINYIKKKNLFNDFRNGKVIGRKSLKRSNESLNKIITFNRQRQTPNYNFLRIDTKKRLVTEQSPLKEISLIKQSFLNKGKYQQKQMNKQQSKQKSLQYMKMFTKNKSKLSDLPPLAIDSIRTTKMKTCETFQEN